MRAFRLHIAATLLLAHGLASGAEPADGHSAEYITCLETSNARFHVMISCMNEELSKQEERLQINLQAVMEEVEKPVRHDLLNDQRLWVKYRNSDCAQRVSEDEPLPDGFNQASCMLNMTRKRADNLHRLLGICKTMHAAKPDSGQTPDAGQLSRNE